MSVIDWTDKLSVGIESIDQQHKVLIGLINKLNHAMAGGEASIAISDILDELTNYTEYHFEYEESLLVEFDYPNYQKHHGSHRELITQLEGLKLNFESDISGAIGLEIMQFLQSWLTHHILKSDKAYSEFLTRKGVC
jgi:hemerythrin